jgi:PadR family transcriptional regulator PadR
MPRIPDTSPQTLRVFTALLEDPAGWHYGYGLSKQTGLVPGTLYPILARLVDRELLETRWEPSSQPGRPQRHMYRLTAEGLTLAHSRVAAITAKPAVTPTTGRPAPSLRTAI